MSPLRSTRSSAVWATRSAAQSAPAIPPAGWSRWWVQDTFGHSGPGGDLITEFGLRAANIVDEVCKLCLC